MLTLINLKKCANPKCSEFFLPYTSKQLYCSPQCYIRKNEKVSDFPLFKCPDCGYEKTLDFHPKLSPRKWNEYKCECCGYEVLSDYEEIIAIKIQFKTENGVC